MEGGGADFNSLLLGYVEKLPFLHFSVAGLFFLITDVSSNKSSQDAMNASCAAATDLSILYLLTHLCLQNAKRNGCLHFID